MKEKPWILLHWKRVIIIALLLFAIIYTVYSCEVQSDIEKTADELPQITSRAEMQEALSGSKKMYAVLNAPVSGSAAEDVFDILTDEYIYIQYIGETFSPKVYNMEGLGPQTTYEWEKDYDDLESISGETYLYCDIPIDITGCRIDNADTLTSESQVRFPEDSKAAVSIMMNYYYPEGMGENPNAMEENSGLKRYAVYLMKSGTDISFLAWIGDNEITFCKTGENSEISGFAAVVQHGELSDLKWIMESGEVGDVIIIWIGVLFLIIVIPLCSYYAEESRQSVENVSKKGTSKNEMPTKVLKKRKREKRK